MIISQQVFHLLFILGPQVHGKHRQGCSHILILNQNIGRHFQMRRSKAPNCLDAAVDQLIANGLGILGRYRDNTHPHLMQPAKAFQLIHGIDGFPLLGLLCSGCNIKSRQNVQTVFIKAVVAQKSLTQLAGTDKNSIGGIVIAQELLDIFDEVLSLLTYLGTAAIRNNGQILAYLHITESERPGQSSCGNIDRCALGNILQICQIAGKPL